MKQISLKPQTKTNFITYAIAIGAFAIAYLMVVTGVTGSLFKGLLIPICYFVILAVSLNLTVGFLGELSLGHAGFMCVGAFSSSIFSVLTKETISSSFIRFPLALIVGGITAGLFGLIIGIPVLRLRGDYLAIVTLAFGEIIKNVVNNLYIATGPKGILVSMSSSSAMNWDPTTTHVVLNGPSGIDGTPQDSTIIVAFILVLVTMFVIMNLVNSRAGRAIISIRDNRIAAESVGINITKYKLIALVVSAFFAGIAGVLYSHNLSTLTATPKNFGYNMSIMILVFVVLGGMGSIRGSIIAAVVLTVLPEWLRFMADYRMLIYAIVLIAMMLLNNSSSVAVFKEKMMLKFKVYIEKFKAYLKKLFSRKKNLKAKGE